MRKTDTKEQAVERFWSRVSKTETCWTWIGYLNDKGYGYFESLAWGLVGEKAHRASWVLNNGPIPGDLCVLHKCDNPACVRPDHLFLGTRTENNADMGRKGRAAQGEKHHWAKLTNEEVLEIHALSRQLGIGYRTLHRLFGDLFGVRLATFKEILSGHRHKWAVR